MLFHMYKEGIHDVTFVLCNTDNQALAESPVPVKLQLGRSITEGLGAGNKPERASAAAEESIEDIKTLLSDGTKMVLLQQVWVEEPEPALPLLLLKQPRKWIF